MLSSLLLSALCCLPSGDGHAGLHPANTNVYLEVPDIPAAIAAYERAPVAQLFRDPSVREFLGALTERDPEEISFATMVDMVLEETREDLPEVGLMALELLPEVERISLSLSGIELEGLSAEILESEGAWSEKLGSRAGKLRALAVLDFANAESANGATELIRSQLEGEGAVFDGLTRSSASAEFGGQEMGWSIYRGTVDEVVFSVWVASHESRLVLGSGLTADPSQLFPVRESLASTEGYRTCSEHMSAQGGVTVLESYSNVHGLLELPNMLDLVPEFASDLKPAAALLLEVLYPDGVIQERGRVRLIEGRFITETFSRELNGPDAKRFRGGGPVGPESLAMVPAEAVGVWATHLDKEGIHEFVLRSLAELTGSEPGDVMVTLEEEYGFRPDRDLIQPLGGRMVFYTMPFTGIGVPKMYVALELEDQEAFARGMEGLGNYLVDLGSGAIEFRSKPYRKQPFMSFAPGQDLEEATSGMKAQGVAAFVPFLSFSVAAGVLEDRAILSLSSMYTKREMKRLLKEESEAYSFPTDGVDLPEDALGLGRTDWGAILGGVYDSVLGFLPLIEQGLGEELPFSIEDLPSSALFSTYFLPTLSWDRRVEGGVYELSESSFGPEVPALFTVGVSLALFGSATTVQREDERLVVAEETEPHQGDFAASTERSMKELKVVLVVYKSDVGRFPQGLEDLLEPTQNFPNGFLEGGRLPTDGWGQGFHYSTDERGAGYRLWSSGANGTDEAGEGDDVVLDSSAD